jgi:DNA-binding transcriptional LysR family regulator
MNAPTAGLLWDDVRFVVAVARAGSLRKAAAELSINHATLSRHLASLQEGLGVRLFERRGRKLELTPAGRELREVGLKVEAQLNEASRRLAGKDRRLHGVVRIALPSSLMRLLAPSVPEFLRRFSGIQLEFLTGLTFKNLSQREADVAVRVADAPHATLVGRRIAPFPVAAFGTRALLDAIEPCQVADYPWVRWCAGFDDFPMERWLRDEIVAAAPGVRVDSEEGVLEMLRAGVGVGFIPCLVGNRDPALRRVAAAGPVFTSALWVLTHEDLRRTPRVKVVTKWLSEALLHHVTGQASA